MFLHAYSTNTGDSHVISLQLNEGKIQVLSLKEGPVSEDYLSNLEVSCESSNDACGHFRRKQYQLFCIS